MNTSSLAFDFSTGPFGDLSAFDFTAAATIALTNTSGAVNNGDIINAIVRGGSVCEIAYVYSTIATGDCATVVRIGEPGFAGAPPGGTELDGTINEFVTNFQINAGDGVENNDDGDDYFTARGEGFLRLIFNSCTGEAVVNEIYIKVEFDDFVS